MDSSFVQKIFLHGHSGASALTVFRGLSLFLNFFMMLYM